ncbi:hypothetical protein EGY31_14285 [Burkholderia multivorans]|uniref:hypothetical protein n=1 Tax=Burkholderia ubonensis TaxID=101571 RepID=UPI000F6D0DAF|nr:hypothetical protein [Burkholderia ubonensis]AYZ64532.1 hypothetical protein EGY31_14285 [Burkholderia multivorans]VWB08124.1 hypothetical protein BUB20358_00197 [Burkholderia ubonensis]
MRNNVHGGALREIRARIALRGTRRGATPRAKFAIGDGDADVSVRDVDWPANINQTPLKLC